VGEGLRRGGSANGARPAACLVCLVCLVTTRSLEVPAARAGKAGDAGKEGEMRLRTPVSEREEFRMRRRYDYEEKEAQSEVAGRRWNKLSKKQCVGRLKLEAQVLG
jgi:hypothetical protein